MAYSKTPASLGSKKEYARYFGSFRGVDFSSEQTDVHENRFAYAVNVYKDYQSGQGTAVETIPGFRRRISIPGTVHSIYPLTESTAYAHIGSDVYYIDYDEKEEIKKKIKVDREADYDPGDVKSSWVRFGNKIILLAKSVGVLYETWEKDKETDKYIFSRSVYPITAGAYAPITYAEIADKDAELGFTEAYEQKNIANDHVYNIFQISFEANNATTYVYLRNKGNPDSVVFDGVILSEKSTVGGEAKGYVYKYDDVFERLEITRSKTTNPETGELKVYIQTNTYTFGDSREAPTISGKEAIENCTVAAAYDNRLFLSGNPELPNHVFWCGINQETNLPDVTYWGEYDFVQDGVGSAKVKAMIPVANALMVLKEESKFEGSVYYHSPMSTGTQIAPVTYPPTQGLYGTGCLGAATNFLDDPVFISRLGLEGIGTLSVRLERAVEHRSSLVDAKLVTQKGLKDAEMVEWNGYLCILVDGNIFMADSRQRYTDSNGIMQYEWYYLEGIGVWKDEAEGRKFCPACCLTATTDNLFFGTTNGVICSFNFDMRDDNGEIPPTYYDFDGETIYSAVATKMDNCGIPHLTKSTVKKSVVIKTRTLVRSAAKVKVRTTKSAYEQIGRIASSRFDFNNVDFEDLSFETSDTTVFALTEKTKRWMEKQYVIYSDELHKPLSINYIAYRYTVAGRYKE